MNNNTNTIRTWLKLIGRASLVVAAGALLATTLDQGGRVTEAEVVPASAVRTTGTDTGADLEGEIWWTTTDCPAGVEAPCLDPTVDPADLPAYASDDDRHYLENIRDNGDCDARGLITAEDYSCVAAGYYDRAATTTSVTIEYGEVSEEMWTNLLGRGYIGDPSDGIEALYVPADVAQAQCVTASDCLR